MSLIIRSPEVLRQQVIQQQRDRAQELAKQGKKLVLAAAGGTPPPTGPSNFNDPTKYKKFLEKFRFDNSNKITDLTKNLNNKNYTKFFK